jgi:acyl carrier protein
VNTTDARALLARLVGGIAPEADLDEVDPDAPLQEALDLDSMDFLNLVAALHDATGLEVPERDYPALSTAAGFASYVADATG